MFLGWALGVFFVCSAWTLAWAMATIPIGPVEEHFSLGQRLHSTGHLGAAGDPGFLRPPGYPVFVASVLAIRDAGSALLGLVPVADGGDRDAVLVAHCGLIGLTAVVLFAFASVFLPPFDAACIGLTFGFGPFALALAGGLTYPLLHLTVLTIGTLLLATALVRERRDAIATFVAGAVWGLASLVRPVSLLLPPFVLAIAWLRKGGAWKPALVFATRFTAGMILVLLPYAARNYVSGGRFLPFNTQAGFAIWASTVRVRQPGEDFLDWEKLWRKHGMPVYRQITGESSYSYATFATHSYELDRLFARRALENVRRRPDIYLRNVVSNFFRFVIDSVAWWPQLYAHKGGIPASRTGSRIVPLAVALGLLSLPGLVLGIARRDPWALAVAAVFVTLTVTHAVTFTHPRYTYPKLPLTIMALALSLRELRRGAHALSPLRERLPLTSMAAVIMLLWSVVVTSYLLRK